MGSPRGMLGLGGGSLATGSSNPLRLLLVCQSGQWKLLGESAGGNPVQKMPNQP